jgi:hypothetical protein
MKICPVGYELLHADGQTVAFRNFANAPKTLVSHTNYETQTSINFAYMSSNFKIKIVYLKGVYHA